MKLRCCLLLCVFLVLGRLPARASRPLAPVPPEIASTHFTVTVDGQSTPVMHAALNLYFLNFEARRHALITVTAEADDYWASGVEVQPWRLNVRPQRAGRTISFRLDGPAKISISRPGDFASDSEMLYLFANEKEVKPPTASAPGLHFFGPGVHRENIDAAEGDRIYLAPGAVVFGSLNIWQVNHVSVTGRGVIVYDGPQNPADDDGWMHKRNWHCIVMDQAHDISIDGITCVVRSRTWQIQMKDSRRIVFNNIKVIGANEGNANADGMDWLGGGDTVVRDCFFRAADDIFAMQTSWEGYDPVAFAVEGQPVTNITVERNVLSTSISNIVRAGWPEKNFVGGNFVMRDSDVLHMGLGGCGIPFALMELWADPNGRGKSNGFTFENIRMEDWYSLVQLQQPTGSVDDASFKDVAGLEYPSLVPSTLKGTIHDVSFSGLMLGGAALTTAAEVPLQVSAGADAAVFASDGPGITIVATEGLIRPGQRVHLEAVPVSNRGEHLDYEWLFGDGSHAHGRKVSHKFPDSEGTLHDGTGRFRVLLQVTNTEGRHAWLYRPVIVADALRPALSGPAGQSLTYTYVEGASEAATSAAQNGHASQPDCTAVQHRDRDYTLSFEGDFEAPADGGYSFLTVANEAALLEIDGVRLASSRPPIAQVCGLAGMAARAIPASAALQKGRHHLRVTETHSQGTDNFRLLWQGPGFQLRPMDASVWTQP